MLARPLRGRRKWTGEVPTHAQLRDSSHVGAALADVGGDPRGCRSARWRHRIPLLWLWRLLLGGFAVVYLASETLQAWLPPLLPFLAAVAVEAQFFVAGLRQGRQQAGATTDRGPQPRDLAEFGWANRTLTVRDDEAELVLRPGEMADAEIVECSICTRRSSRRCRHELAQIEDAESPVAPYVAPPPVAPPSKVRRRLLQALIVLALFTGVFFLDKLDPRWQNLSASTRSATITVLNREASRIAGHPAEVLRRQRPPRRIRPGCGRARRGRRTPDVADSGRLLPPLPDQSHAPVGRAVLGQGACGLRSRGVASNGVSREAIANCYAYQSGVSVGQALGLTAGTARGLMHEQLADNPADFDATPAYVVPHGCQAGGSFDLHLDGDHFP